MTLKKKKDTITATKKTKLNMGISKYVSKFLSSTKKPGVKYFRANVVCQKISEKPKFFFSFASAIFSILIF